MSREFLGQECPGPCWLLQWQSFRQKKVGREQPALRCGPQEVLLMAWWLERQGGDRHPGPTRLPLMAVSSFGYRALCRAAGPRHRGHGHGD